MRCGGRGAVSDPVSARLSEGALEDYAYRGARALVLLHEVELRRCLVVWRQAKAAGVVLPQTDDPDYTSLETLLVHILGAARGYMVWICTQLELPDPNIRPKPDAADVEREAEGYLEHLLERWRLPLADIPEGRFEPDVYRANWGTPYAVEAMLEHALVHPMRHRFQLTELLQVRRMASETLPEL
jgi:uncharacterized damage-inducible protein DinB